MIHLLYNQDFADVGITLVEGPDNADFDALWKEFDDERGAAFLFTSEKVVEFHERFEPKTPAETSGLENRLVRFFANWLCANKGFKWVPHEVTEI